ncbi:MAG: phosphate/phosphite/phosphonate ABC transporter substrate-binding protein [Oscillospiraceae bacterium]|jgi:phosphonate transport system substrate-binding protein|nr:phosphate/phosphite/phosphonate ABC transporter substrate-binding protein [Oscillospiraceae bacterium]
MKINKVISIAAVLLTVFMFFGGCQESSAPTAAPTATDNGKADWPAKITIVQMPDENNPDAGSIHEGFRTEMEEYLGIKIEELEGSDYTVGIEAMKSGKLEVLLVSPMSYYQAKRVADIEPLVTTSTNGAVPYKTVFITRSDRDDINSLEDLEGKTFAFVDPASSSGYLYPKTKLVTALELDPEKLENPNYFFSTVAYSGKHDSSLMGVVMGDYDAAAVALQMISGLADAGIINEDDIKIIGETDEIPNACFVIRADLPQSLKDAIRDFYLQYDDSGYFEAFYGTPDMKFVEVQDSDYDVVTEMVEILKIEE